MPSVAVDLAQLLDGVRRPGDFCTGGVCEIFAPGLEVQGVGPIALPLLPAQAGQMIAVAERAPFGRGEQTLVDIDVRRAWQINADQVRIHGQAWARTLASLVERVAEGLGVTDPVGAELYKLLVYEEGDFFVGHRDTEKAAGMFATLVIVLPSIFTGGELLVRHQGREVRFDLRASDPSEAAFAAFYADCLHEVAPVTSGCRLTLIYNLLRRTPGEAPRPPSHEAERDGLSARLRRWAEDEDEDQAEEAAPQKLIYLLEHAYTPASLSFEALKGTDAARAATLLAAARAAECDLYLALLSIEESGSAEHTGAYRSYRRGRRDDDDEDDEFEVIEVCNSSETLSDWRGPDGDDPGLGLLPFDPEEEMSPPDALEELVPDDVNFTEATGNEGASFERSYRRAALVLWPSRTRLAIVNQGGLPTTLPYLTALVERWVASGEDDSSPLWTQAHELSGHMLASWPMDRWRPTKSQSDATTLLALLGRLGDTGRIDDFLEAVCAGGALGRADGEGVLPAIGLLPRRRRVELLERIIAANAATALDACADLLGRAVEAIACGQLDLRPAELEPAAAALLAALPGDPARAAQTPSWIRPRAMEPSIVVDVLTALDQIHPGLAGAAADAVLAWPGTYDLDAVVVPAVLATRQSRRAETTAVGRLRAAGVAHLRARIAEPLAPPRDWTRPGAVTCPCDHCRELGCFLVDAARETWSFKAPQSDRSHLENKIRTQRYDVDFTTLRRSSPHSLVCTKNQASYELRARQRGKDLEDLTKLEERR
jgi:predicted 2-oxoglutarate/Fe(II)-dependent dioxygenase YbiX